MQKNVSTYVYGEGHKAGKIIMGALCYMINEMQHYSLAFYNNLKVL